MRLHDLARDRQAKAIAAGARTRLVHLVEALEDALSVLGRDVRASVVDGQDGCPRRAALAQRGTDTSALDHDRHPDAAGRRSELEGVLEQVVEHLSDAVRVPQDRYRLGRVYLEMDAV